MSSLLTCILLYAGLLRLDALFKTYGPYDHPRWLAAMQPSVRAAASSLTPDWRWRHIAEPYVGGDPINYLKYAREMRNFYAAHVREPMFPAATRVGLILTGNADVGVSVTSIAFALLTLVATYALGAHVASPAVGLAAAAAMGIDQSAVGWSIGGWRDELFAFFAIACTWAWARFARRPGHANAAIAGLLSGGACLTRITSIALVAPAVIWLLATRSVPRGQLGLAVSIMAALVTPFLINCAIATGDPLYAINNHTDFYLKREAAADLSDRSGNAAKADVTPISAVSYSLDKFDTLPIAATDNAMLGVFVYPFSNKWVGLDEWLPGLGTTLACLAIAGLVAWLWQPEGRLLLFIFLASLVPFSMTWTVRGGAEWRLTLFAYAFYLVAAFWLVDAIVRHLRGAIRQDGATQVAPYRMSAARRPIAILLGMLAFAGVWTFAMPYAVAREALRNGGPAMLRAGWRDRWFFADGWSTLVVTGNVTSRFSTEPSAALRIPLPESRPYKIVLRMDPLYYPGAPAQRAHVSLNGHPVAVLDLTWNPARVGEYPLSLPATAARRGWNDLRLRSETMAPVGRAGRAFPEISRDREVGLRLWYVLVVPS